jgi:hypothetical protein
MVGDEFYTVDIYTVDGSASYLRRLESVAILVTLSDTYGNTLQAAFNNRTAPLHVTS